MIYYPKCLTIAGSDSGGGAGIQADLKTMSAIGVFGTSAITAITAQNTCEVRDIQGIEPDIVRQQIEAVLDDLPCTTEKLGELYSLTTINTNPQTTTIINPEKIASCMQPTHMKKKPTTKMKSFFLPNTPHVPTLKSRP